MSEEEQEAIEYWKNYMDILHWNTQLASEHYMKILLDYIDKLQKENEHLKEQLQISNSLDNMYNLYISKDKIREKIKELKGNKDFDEDVYVEEFAVDILKELLEEE